MADAPNTAASSPSADRSAAPSGRGRRWGAILRALRQRTVLVMLALGVASGLPFAALIGTLNAWLTQADVAVGTIGVISFIGLAYSFNFLWAPALQSAPSPIGRGRRRGWMITLQALTVLALLVIALSDPGADLARLTAAAAAAAVLSASLHVVVDAWRIEIADEETPIDLLSTVYQAGFRTSGFLAGAVALLLAERIGWNTTYLIVAALAALCCLATVWAREPKPRDAASDDQTGPVAADVGGRLRPEVRLAVLVPVLIGWAWAVYAIASFMVAAVTQDPPPSARTFTRSVGPWIVLVTVLAPAFAAALVLRLSAAPSLCGPSQIAALSRPVVGGFARAFDVVFAAILAPLVDLVGRLKWAVALVLVLVLSYRFTDQVWGAFAYTFYLGDPAVAAGALQHTLDDVFVASKTFGVGMTITGIVIGGAMLLRIGRMPTLFLGAVLAAVTNLLYADLALGAPRLDAFLAITQLDHAFAAFGFDQRMARLMTAIAGENLALGVASAAFVAYLSSIVNPRYAAVQYALLASLALLIGTFGRGALGEMIETDGFAPVFILTAWLGAVAVVACILEWARQRRIAAAAEPQSDPA